MRIGWVLAVRLGPRGFRSAQVQISTVIHRQAASRVWGVQHIPGFPRITPVVWNRISYLLVGFVGFIRTALQGRFTCTKSMPCTCITPKHIMYPKAAAHISWTTFFSRMTLADIENLYPSPMKNHNQNGHSILSRGASNWKVWRWKKSFSQQNHLSDGACWLTVALKSVKKRRNYFHYYQTTPSWTCAPTGSYQLWVGYNWTKFISALKKS